MTAAPRMTDEEWLARELAKAPPLTEQQQVNIRRILGRSRSGDRPAPLLPPVPVETRTAIYFHYDADDVLLYVGISNDPLKRTREHSRRSIWSQWTVRSESRWYDSKRKALDAEAVAIRSDLPLFNEQLNDAPDLRRRQVQYLLDRGALDLLRPDTSR